MLRMQVKPRPDWQATIESQGISWAMIGDEPYWSEAMESPAYYSLRESETALLKQAATELYQRMLDAVSWLLERSSLAERRQWVNAFGLSNELLSLIERSWEEREPCFYGRFDFFMEYGVPKMLEYNAETPSTLIESSIAQASWANGKPQFNAIHLAMVDYWRNHPHCGAFHFAHLSDEEDVATVKYIASCAAEAGREAIVIPMDKIGYYDQHFVDLDDKPIEQCFKLYPYHWMMEDDFAEYVLTSNTRWIEPPWCALLGNKAMLALLWYLNPNHPNLVEAHTQRPEVKSGDVWVTKPLLGRAGQNVTVSRFESHGMVILDKTHGACGDGDWLYQCCISCDTHDRKFPMMGVWMVGGEAVGLGIRESDEIITTENSRFIPHVISG